MAIQPGFFDMTERSAKLTQMGDPLVGLNEGRFYDAIQKIENVKAEFKTLKGKERFEFRKENLRSFRLD